MKALGIFCYSQSLRITAERFDVATDAVYENTKKLKFSRIIAAAKRNMKYTRVPYFFDLAEFLETHREQYDVVYGQPNTTGRQENYELKFAVDVASNMLKTENILFVVPARISSKHNPKYWTDWFDSLNSSYKWTIAQVNAMAVGSPINAEYLIIIGNKNGLSPRLNSFEIEQIKDIPVVYPFIRNLVDVLPSETGAVQVGRIFLDGHAVPELPAKQLKYRLLWESVPLLKEGEKLYNVEKRPAIWHERDGKILKTQMPIRLDRYMPAPTISSDPKFIHPIKNRPMTLREVARLIGFPDDHRIGREMLEGHRILSSFIPKPIAEYAFLLVERLQRDIVAKNPTYMNTSRAFVLSFRQYQKEYKLHRAVTVLQSLTLSQEFC